MHQTSASAFLVVQVTFIMKNGCMYFVKSLLLISRILTGYLSNLPCEKRCVRWKLKKRYPNCKKFTGEGLLCAPSPKKHERLCVQSLKKSKLLDSEEGTVFVKEYHKKKILSCFRVGVSVSYVGDKVLSWGPRFAHKWPNFDKLDVPKAAM